MQIQRCSRSWLGRWLLWGLALAVAPAALTACASAGPNKGQFNLVSLQEEWQLGDQLHRDVARQMDLVNDPVANDYINLLGQRLAAQTYYRQLPWRFHIVNDPAINAFAVPGGHLYVHTGLIKATDNVAELASVMAHELAHGVARHGTENLTKQYGFGAIASLVLGNNPAIYQQLLAQVVGGGLFAKYSRDAEREADRLGLDYMYAAGYDPTGMVTMFQELLAQRRNSPGGLEKFFSSHPLTEERISNTRALIAQLPPRGNLILRDARFDEVRSRMSGYR
ncbi:MAG: M48 family metallopeptidase [Gemmatimonadota bacterium]